MNNTSKFIGVVGGSIGSDPFNRRTFSGSSYFLFTTMQRKGVLQRAFGADLEKPAKAFFAARNYHPNRGIWRKQFYLDIGYRNALTKRIIAQIRPDDVKDSFLQVGAMFDVPSAMRGKVPCFAFHDGNLPEAIAGGQMEGLSAKTLDAALRYEQDLALRCDLIFTTGEFLRQSFIRDFDVNPSKVITVGGGPNFEIPEFNGAKLYDTQELLYVGNDFDRKGGWNLLKAFANVRQRFPAAKLHIIGPNQLQIPAEQSAGVVYHGYVSRENDEGAALFKRLYNRCAVFVLPSLYEPFGMSSLEAMLHQVPVVVTRGWGWLDTVRHGFNGFHVERGNVDELTETLSHCLETPDMLRTMGKNAREFIIGNFTWDSVVDRMGAAAAALSVANKRAEAASGD